MDHEDPPSSMVEEQRISPVLCVPCAWWAAGPGLLISALGWSISGTISYLMETHPSELQQDCPCGWDTLNGQLWGLLWNLLPS